MKTWMVWGIVPLAAVTTLALRYRSDKFAVFVALYAWLSLVFGAIFLGGAGVDWNVLFDADIALALGGGLVLNRFAGPAEHRDKIAAAIAIIYVLPLAFTLYAASTADWLDPDVLFRREDVQIAGRDIAFLHSQDGAALCETLSLCYWAGTKARVDVFNVGQQFATNTRSDEALVRLIDRRAFRVMQFETLSPFALTQRVRRAIERGYRLDHSDDFGVFFVPR